jgi:hypothetical protein
MNFLCAYFGSFSCINAYVFKGLLGHKDPVPSDCTPLARGPYRDDVFQRVLDDYNGQYTGTYTSERSYMINNELTRFS